MLWTPSQWASLSFHPNPSTSMSEFQLVNSQLVFTQSTLTNKCVNITTLTFNISKTE